tara:strand:- start:425 stop:1000 length:576 start_codon:yes stop_codon:yes gene_type:complete
LKKKINLILVGVFFSLLFANSSLANLQEELLSKYKAVNTLSFDFKQKIGDKVEFGSCYIKYPLLMKCEYPKKKKSIITNGKKFAIVKRRYKKIYSYPLEKTPLFYILNKKNILNVIKNYEPFLADSNFIEYELTDSNSGKINIFFDKRSLELSGWKTIDAYSNEVNFLLRNIETNISINNEIFKIPREEDL